MERPFQPMLVIRRAQMGALADARRRELYLAIAAHLRTEHASAAAAFDEDQLLECVRLGCRRAAAWRFTRESSLATFVVLMFTVAPDFDAHPAVRRLLEDERAPVDRRLLLAAHRLTGAQWNEVRAASRAGWADLGGKGSPHGHGR